MIFPPTATTLTPVASVVAVDWAGTITTIVAPIVAIIINHLLVRSHLFKQDGDLKEIQGDVTKLASDVVQHMAEESARNNITPPPDDVPKVA